MHKVSQQTIQIVQKHAKQSLEHGKSVEELAEKLKTGDSTEQEISQRIEPYSETLQQHAQEFLQKAQQLTEDGSTEVFSESVQAHINATQAYVEAVKEFQNRLQTDLHQKQP